MQSYPGSNRRPIGYWLGTALAMPMLLAVAVAFIAAATLRIATEVVGGAWPR